MIRGFLTLWIVMNFISDIVHGQENIKLSLIDAVAMGLEQNYQLRIAVLQTSQAKNQNTWGMAGALPDLTAQSAGRYSKSENNNPFNYITAVTNDNTYKSRSASQALDLGWTLFNGFRVHAQKSKFSLIQQQSLGNEQLVMENTVQAIILSYYRVKVEEEKLDVLGQLLQLSGDRYKRSAQKKKIGAKTTFEFLQDKNIYLTDSTNWISQKLVRKNALRSFNMLIAVSDDKSWELTDKLIYNEPDWKYNALLDSMRSNNYNLKNQYLNLEVLKKDINIQRSQLYPRINFGLGLNYGDQKFENSMGVGGGTSTDYYGNASLNFNIFNGGQVRKAIQNAKIELDIGQVQIEEQVHTLTNSLKQFYEQFEARGHLFGISSENKETALLNMKLAKEREALGAISSFDLRDIQLRYLNASISSLEYLYQWFEAKLEVMRLSGQILKKNGTR